MKEYQSEIVTKVRNYNGVLIYKVKTIVCGSDLKELKNGELRPCKPTYTISFKFCDSYLYNSVDECIKAIEDVKRLSVGLTDKEFANILNNSVNN